MSNTGCTILDVFLLKNDQVLKNVELTKIGLTFTEKTCSKIEVINKFVLLIIFRKIESIFDKVK